MFHAPIWWRSWYPKRRSQRFRLRTIDRLKMMQAAVRKLLDGVTQKIRAQNNSINDLLAEGTEIAKRLQEKMSSASKGLAGGVKKR